MKPDSTHLQTTVSAGASSLALFANTSGAIATVTNASGPSNPSTNPNAANPVPGGAGVPIDFWKGTTDSKARWQTKTDKNGNVTLYENYDADGNPGRVVEGWVPQQSGATTFTPGDGFTRRREYVYHPVLKTPTTTTEVSAVSGVFGEKVTTDDYTDPLNPGGGPTTHLFSETVTGKTLNASGAVVSATTTTTYNYNATGQLVSVTGPNPANYTQYLYDAATGYRTAVQRYLAGSGSAHLDTTFSNFDSHGNPQTVTDPNGRVTSFTYDIQSRVKTATPPYEGTGSTTITFTYSVDGDLTRVDFPPDTGGNAVYLKMGYDAKRNLTFLADSQANAIVYDYTNGRVTEESRYTGFTSLTSRGTRVGDATFSYDSAARLVKAFNPLFSGGSVFTQFGPDGNGNPVTVTDENTRTDNLAYDALDRLTQIQQVRSATYTTHFGYDPLSNVSSVTDAAGKATDLLHDDWGRLVRTVSTDTGTTLFLYDAAGNLVQKIEDATGTARVTSYSYDGLNRLTGITYPNDPAWTFNYDTSATLNQKGRLASVSNGVVTTQLEYTQRGDVAVERTVVDGLSYAVSYSYDAAGNRTSITTPDAAEVDTAYAGLRPSSLTLSDGGSSASITNVAFYPFGPRTQAKFPPYDAGLGANTVTSTRQVNLRGQVTQVHVASAAATYLDRSYVYDYTTGGLGPIDPGPNLDEVVDTLDPTESRFYFYDDLDRLQKATDLSGNVLFQYGYDAVGNRTSQVSAAGTTNYSYESGTDRLDASSGAGALDYAHDAFGNRIYQGAGYAGTASLVYDQSNRLVQAKDPASGFAVLGTYTYDAFGRRVKKTTASQSFVYLYDSDGHLVEEIEKKSGTDHARVYAYLEDELVGLVDADVEVGAGSAWLAPRGRGPAGPPLWVFGVVVLGGAALLLVARRHPQGAAAATSAMLLVFMCASAPPTSIVFSWVHTDPLGTPLAITNTPMNPGTTPAAVVWRAKYEPFGKATVNQDPDGDGTAFTLNVRFPGQYADGETLLTYNYMRFYDPNAGRFVTVDPVGLLGGLNQFVYAGNRPILWIDPIGLYTIVHFWSGVGHGESSFGHADIDINGVTYSFGPNGLDTQPTSEWINRETKFRSGSGFGLGLSSEEETQLADCISGWSRSKYSPLSNNCTNPIASCLHKLGYGVPSLWSPQDLYDWFLNSPRSPAWSSYQFPARGGQGPTMPWSPRF